jgi:YbbR domain-containing protein
MRDLQAAVGRLVGLVWHDWPLKVAALALSLLLYGALVVAQNVQVFPGTVPIEPVNLPADVVLLGSLGSVGQIRYVAPPDVPVSRDTFRATVDLGGARPTPDNPYVNVAVRLVAVDTRVQILDFSPQRISVQLDPLMRKVVPIQVEWGSVPAGLQVGTPQLSVQSAVVAGPASVVRLVTAARAQVVIQPSGLDVDADVPLVAVDVLGETKSPVDIEPASVHVRIVVTSRAQSRTLPVNPLVVGSPADGYAVSSVTVDPPVVSVSGEADAIAALLKVDTASISVAGATADVTRVVPLALPDRVTVLGPASVTVHVSIVPLSGTRTFSVGIALSGARSDRAYTLSTDRILVTLGGSLAVLDALAPDELFATVDVSHLVVGSASLPVSVALPSGVDLVAASPGSVVVTVAIPSPSPATTPLPSSSGG